MASAPIGRPALKYSRGNITPALTRVAQVDNGSSNVFDTQQFVVLTSGKLAKYAADGALIWGLSPDKNHAPTDEPYTQPYGSVHNAIDPRGATFLMNGTDSSGTVGSGTTTQAAFTIGTAYSSVYLGSGDTGCLAVAASGGSNALFKVVGYWPEDATTDFNGRLLVELVSTGIQ